MGHLKLGSLTIATPFYNEEEGINHYINTILKVLEKLPIEIKPTLIWVDDGSNDNTLSILKEKQKFLNQFKIKIIAHKKNYGYGRTLLNSIKNSNTDLFITYDADCCYDYNLIFELLKVSQEMELDIVSVSYKLANKKMNVSLFRNFLAYASIFLYKFMFKSLRKHKLSYFNCSFRIYKLDVIKDIFSLSDDFNACAELLIKSTEKDIKIGEIPGENTGRNFGKSKMKVFKNIINSLITIIKMKLGLKPKNKLDNRYEII